MKQTLKTIYTVILAVLLAACGVATPVAGVKPVETASPTLVPITSTPVVDPTIITVGNVDRLVQMKQIGMGPLVSSPLYSPDGKWIYLPTASGIFKLDTSTYSYDDRQLLTPLFDYIGDITLSPDGSLLTLGNHVLSTEDGHELNSPNIPHMKNGNGVRSSAFSPDGSMLAVIYGGDDNPLHVYRMSDGQLLYSLNAIAVEFSPDSRYMVMVAMPDANLPVELHDAQTGTLIKEWAGNRAVFLDADHLAVEGSGAIRIHEISTGKVPYAFNGRDAVSSLDGQYMAFLSKDQVEIHSMVDGKLLHKIGNDFDATGSIDMQFSPDGRTISIFTYRGACCGGGYSTSSLWSVLDGTLIKDGRGARFAYSSDGRMVTLPSEMGLQVLSTSDGSVQASIIGLMRIGRLLAFHPDTGDLIAFDGYFEHTFLMYDLNTNQSKWVQLSDLGSIGFSLDQAGKFSALSPYIYGYWEDQRLEVLKPMVQEQTHHDPHGIMFSPDGRILAVGTRYSGVLNLWDIQEQRLILEESTCPEKMVNSLAFSPDGRWIAVACTDHIWESWGEPEIHVWQIQPTPQHPMTLSGYGYTLVTYSPDGRFVAGAGNHVQVWDAIDGSPVFSVEYSFESLDAQSVAFSQDGEILAYGLKDGSVELWSVQHGKQIRVMPGGGYNPVLALAFSPNGKYLAMGFDNGSVQVWGIP